MAEYPDEEKDAISHRGKALRQLAAQVEAGIHAGEIVPEGSTKAVN